MTASYCRSNLLHDTLLGRIQNLHRKGVRTIQRQFLQRVAGAKAKRVSLVEDRATRLAWTLHPANLVRILVQRVEVEKYRRLDCGKNLFIGHPFS